MNTYSSVNTWFMEEKTFLYLVTIPSLMMADDQSGSGVGLPLRGWQGKDEMDSQTYANIAEGEDLSTPDRNGMRYMMSYLRSLVTSADHEGTLRAGSGYSSHFMESERLSRLWSFRGMIAIFMWRRAACGPWVVGAPAAVPLALLVVWAHIPPLACLPAITYPSIHSLARTLCEGFSSGKIWFCSLFRQLWPCWL